MAEWTWASLRGWWRSSKQSQKIKIMKGRENYSYDQRSCSLSGRGQWQKTNLSQRHQLTGEQTILPRQTTLHHHHIKGLKKESITNALKCGVFFHQGSLMIPTDVGRRHSKLKRVIQIPAVSHHQAAWVAVNLLLSLWSDSVRGHDTEITHQVEEYFKG